jgi:hypothetical protein
MVPRLGTVVPFLLGLRYGRDDRSGVSDQIMVAGANLHNFARADNLALISTQLTLQGKPGALGHRRREPAVTRYADYQDTFPRSRHRLRTLSIVVIVVLGLLVGLDFGARAFAESKVASQIQQQGFPKKPSVSIEGFPFLTQVIGRDFSDVQLSSSNITEGPLLIQNIDATMKGVHVNSSFNGGTVDDLNGTMNVTFAALASAMTQQVGALGQLAGAGLNLSQAGPNEVKATLDLVVTSGTAVWRVSRTGRNDISIQLVNSSGLTSSLLSGIGNITIPLPSLPLGLSIQTISVTPTGLVGTVTGHNVSFGS